MEKIILITGASHGLGKVIYEYLSQKDDYKVYGTTRNPCNNPMDKPSDRQLLQLDITSNESVKKCLSWLIVKEGRIDVLINNAGINLIGSLEGTSINDFIGQSNTNYLGTVRMIKGVLPVFRKNNKGRIINISSIGGHVPLPYNRAYAGSKAALDAMSESLAYELEGCNIYITVIKPLALTIEDQVPNINYIEHEKDWNKGSRRLFEKMMTKVKPSVSKRTLAVFIEKVINNPKPKVSYNLGPGASFIMLIHDLIPFRLFSRILKSKLF